jgi:4-hydroxybenzoate polyprenyltransferase
MDAPGQPPTNERAVQRGMGTPHPWWKPLRGYLCLPHLVPVLMVELATFAFALIAWRAIPPSGVLVPLMIAMLGGQLAIGAVNDLIDLPDDTLGKPSKPIPSGDVSVRGARVVVAVGLLMMVVFGAQFGPVPFGLLLIGTGLGIAYDLWFKRTRFSWLPYLLALPLLPIWVFAALGNPDARLLLLYPLGGLAAIGVHFAQALPDVAIDRAADLRTPTSVLGQRRTFVLAWAAALTAPLLAHVAAAGLESMTVTAPIVIAAGVSLTFALVNTVVYLLDRQHGELLCFRLVALAILANGLAWALFVAGVPR